MKMDAFGAYQRYHALKLHFTTDYDIKKYKGRTKISRAAFEKNPKNVAIFKRLVNRFEDEKDFIHMLVANFIDGDNYGGIYSLAAMAVYNDWQARVESLSYRFKQDMDYLIRNFDLTHWPEGYTQESYLVELLTQDPSGGHPEVLKAYLGKKISLETLVILERMYYITEAVRLEGDIMWGPVCRLINKYKPFLRVDLERMQGVINTIKEENS